MVITKDRVVAGQGLSPRRICLTSTHANAIRLEMSGEKFGKVSFPFEETIKPIFEQMTGLKLFASNYGGCWRSLDSLSEMQKVGKWRDSIGGIVFLRDCLRLSVALGEHQKPEGGRSEIGELEYQAKYHQDGAAVGVLKEKVLGALGSLPGFRDAEAIAAVPPRPGKDFDLPSMLVAEVARDRSIIDLTPILSWNGKKNSLKGLPVEQKWDALDEVGINSPRKLPSKIIILDDLYQSGTTMQWLAAQLQRFGASVVYGMSLTKSRNDTDNV